MPYPVGHRAATRARIVASARRLFNQHGFESVSVKPIMAGAGLTHGGFYDYFQAKSDLYTEVLSCFLTDPNWQPRWEGVQVDLEAADAGSQIIRAYLSRQVRRLPGGRGRKRLPHDALAVWCWREPCAPRVSPMSCARRACFWL